VEHGHRPRQYSEHHDGGVGEWTHAGRSQSVGKEGGGCGRDGAAAGWGNGPMRGERGTQAAMDWRDLWARVAEGKGSGARGKPALLGERGKVVMPSRDLWAILPISRRARKERGARRRMHGKSHACGFYFYTDPKIMANRGSFYCMHTNFGLYFPFQFMRAKQLDDMSHI
jgi:hypothetical protein